MDELAPIGVSSYTRIDHLRRTIEALKANHLSEKSELYIFSDAPQQGDEQAVVNVRAYADTISGFKRVHVVKREHNSRVQNNRGGMKSLLDNYGKMIWLEEDIVSSNYFLTFMNEALNEYEHNKKIISISGYCPPISIPDSYNKDVFLLKRFNAWGFGTWSHKFNPFSFSIDEKEYTLNIKVLTSVLERYGNDVPRMIKKEVNDELDALDVKVMYYQALHNLYTVYPAKSMTRNIGHDGTGLHCGNTKRFEIELAQKKIKMDTLTEEDESIVKENRKFRNQTGKHFINKIYHRLRNFLINDKKNA
jgi:hypothetical protein